MDTDLALIELKRDLSDSERMSFDVQLAAKEKSPTTALLLSLFFGLVGVDRFYIGDVGLGVFKLLTCGGLFVWAVIDLVLIMGATRRKNVEAGRLIRAGIVALRR